MHNDEPGYKTTELWLTSIISLINTILISAAPTEATIVLVKMLSVVAITYLVCRTVFKVAKLKYRPDDPISFKSTENDKQLINE